MIDNDVWKYNNRASTAALRAGAAAMMARSSAMQEIGRG